MHPWYIRTMYTTAAAGVKAATVTTGNRSLDFGSGLQPVFCRTLLTPSSPIAHNSCSTDATRIPREAWHNDEKQERRRRVRVSYAHPTKKALEQKARKKKVGACVSVSLCPIPPGEITQMRQQRLEDPNTGPNE